TGLRLALSHCRQPERSGDQFRHRRGARVVRNPAPILPASRPRMPRRATRFVAYELPAECITRLRVERNAIADASRFDQSDTRYGGEDSKLIGGINDEITESNAIMCHKYTCPPEKLDARQSASNVERSLAAGRE